MIMLLILLPHHFRYNILVDRLVYRIIETKETASSQTKESSACLLIALIFV